MKPNPGVDIYFKDGCGRCSFFQTINCKVHNWDKELAALRKFILKHELNEELKWGVPCYTLNGKNVLILTALKDCTLVSFFKGALINDHFKLLEKPGPNTQAERVLKFRSMKDVSERQLALEKYITEAIALERSGAKITADKIKPLELPVELANRLNKDPELKTAFEQLTPGRQKGYIIFISGAKQSSTRESRISKCTPLILLGKGLMD